MECMWQQLPRTRMLSTRCKRIWLNLRRFGAYDMPHKLCDIIYNIIYDATSLQPKKTILFVLQHVLLAVNVNLVILDILMAHVWQKMSVTLVALIKLSNHVVVIAVNQPVECQIVRIGTAIILALLDVNVMLDMFETF